MSQARSLPDDVTVIATTLVRALAVTTCLAAVYGVPGLARADDADPKLACSAAFDAGQSLRASGRIRDALSQFAICTREVCPRSLQKACVEQANESSTLLPTIVLSATDGAHDWTDVRVRVDGVEVASVLDGRAIPIDPGIHMFRFEKAGLPAVERSFVVKEGQKGQAISVMFELVNGKVPEPPSSDAQRGSPTMLWAGLGTGAVGVVGIVIGSVYGLEAGSNWTDAQRQAKTASTFQTAEATEATGKNYATVSDVAFIAGGVLAAGGVALIVASRTHGTTSATIEATLGGLMVMGRF